MDKTQLRRHNLVFISQQGKNKILQQIVPLYSGCQLQLIKEIVQGKADIPSFIRRNEKDSKDVAVGFVHPQRLDGNRIRIACFTDVEDIVAVMTPYEVMQRNIYAHEARTLCIKELLKIYELAEVFDLQIGVFGSAALEMVTGLPYTDENSDIDLLLKPSGYNRLLQFYRAVLASCKDINLDFEVELPNGYGVKLAEIFMETQTVLGKSLDNVALLSRKEVMQYLETSCKKFADRNLLIKE